MQLNRFPIHGPLRYTIFSLLNTYYSGKPLVSSLVEKSPLYGSSRAFHDLKTRSKPVLLSQPSFISGSKVSVGKSKLCHKYSLLLECLSTKLPLSRSSATSGDLEVPTVSFVDQTGVLERGVIVNDEVIV